MSVKPADLRVTTVDLKNGTISQIWLDLLDRYARDPMGGGTGLSDFAKAHLVDRLAEMPGFHGALAWVGGQPVGLINCFAGFSTFAARPLLNIHDIVVHADWRGQGVGQALLHWAERQAGQLDCCKLTLEVLSNNAKAMASYARAGYVPYELDPKAGQALLLQKILREE